MALARDHGTPGAGRYTLYRYERLHFAVDCEDCNNKIAGLTPNTISGELLDRIDAHETKFHPAPSTVTEGCTRDPDCPVHPDEDCPPADS